MATAMNVTVGPWVRATPEQTAEDFLAEARALRDAMLADTAALCEEWLTEADEEAHAILARADAEAAAILDAARSVLPLNVVSESEAQASGKREAGPLLGRLRRLLRRRPPVRA